MDEAEKATSNQSDRVEREATELVTQETSDSANRKPIEDPTLDPAKHESSCLPELMKRLATAKQTPLPPRLAPTKSTRLSEIGTPGNEDYDREQRSLVCDDADSVIFERNKDERVRVGDRVATIRFVR